MTGKSLGMTGGLGLRAGCLGYGTFYVREWLSGLARGWCHQIAGGWGRFFSRFGRGCGGDGRTAMRPYGGGGTGRVWRPKVGFFALLRMTRGVARDDRAGRGDGWVVWVMARYYVREWLSVLARGWCHQIAGGWGWCWGWPGFWVRGSGVVAEGDGRTAVRPYGVRGVLGIFGDGVGGLESLGGWLYSVGRYEFC